MSTTTTPTQARAYSFTDHSTRQPGTPQPGDRLDREFDAIYQALAALGSLTQAVQRTAQVTYQDLAPSTIQRLKDQLAPSIADAVRQIALLTDVLNTRVNDVTEGQAAVQARLEQMADSAQRAEVAADQANHTGLAVQAAVQTSADDATDAANSANDAALSAAAAFNDEELAGAWAEYMPSEIPARFFAHTSITGDHWSSRWWANQAAAAFGALTSLYLGAFPQPPGTTPTGGIIPVGAIYFNTTSNQPYVWTGSGWVPFYAPTKALLLSLAYSADGVQTAFPLTTVDLAGNSYTMSATVPEPLDVFVNGVRLLLDQPAGIGDWSVSAATSTVTLTAAPRAGSIVQVDVLVPASQIAPSQVVTKGLATFTPIDGVTTTFPLKLGDNTPVTPLTAVELFISVDGAVQQAGVDFSTAGSSVVFAEAPLVGSKVWSYWYGQGSGSGGGVGGNFLPLTGGTVTGATTFAAPVTLSGGGTLTGTYTGNHTMSGIVTHSANSNLNGQTTVGTNTAAAAVVLNGQAGSSRIMRWATAGSSRWQLQATNAEPGTSNTGADLVLFGYNDSGVSLGQVASFTRATGSFTLDPTKAYASGIFTSNLPIVAFKQINLRANYAINGGVQGAVNSAFWTDGTLTGTSDGAATGGYDINRINYTDNATCVNGYSGRVLMSVRYASGAGASGATTAFLARMGDTGTGTDKTLGQQYTGIAGAFQSVSQFNQGGTALAPSGAGWGLNIVASLLSGATFYNALRAIEINFGIDTGASALNKSAIKITQQRDNVSAGNGDQFIQMGRGASSTVALSQAIVCGGRGEVGWSWGTNSVLYWSDGYSNDFPASGGSQQLACTISSWSADHSVAFARAYGPFGPLLLDGAACQIGTTRIVPSATGSSIDCAGAYGTGTPTVAAGGSGYVIGDRIFHGNGGVCQVATQSGGVVLTVQVLRQPYLTTTTPPANPVATTGDWNTKGTGCTLNVAWNTTANGLSLNPTGQRIGFNGTAPIAKPTVTGSKGANAALASLISALASYGLVVDSST